MVICDDFMDSPDISPAEPAATLKSNGIKPEFGDIVIALDMHMLRFIAITGIEEEPIGPHSENSWHPRRILCMG